MVAGTIERVVKLQKNLAVIIKGYSSNFITGVLVTASLIYHQTY